MHLAMSYGEPAACMLMLYLKPASNTLCSRPLPGAVWSCGFVMLQLCIKHLLMNTYPPSVSAITLVIYFHFPSNSL